MMLLFKPTFARRSKPRPTLSFSESLLVDSIEAAETVTRKWISPDRSVSCSTCSLSSIFSPDNRMEGRKFIEVINSLQYAIQGVKLVNPQSQKLSRANTLISTAMKHLEKEFYRILKSNRRNLDPEDLSLRASTSFRQRKKSSSFSNAPISQNVDVMTDLKMIADCMISSNYKKECVKVYKKIRKSIIVEALNKLGFENLSFGKIQKLDWDSMEKSIKNWLEATKLVIGNLFDGERILSDYIFSPSVSTAESCFSEITVDSALTLFIFPVSVARCRKTPEKIFLTLDVYQTIYQLLPKIEDIFSYNSTSVVRLQAADSLKNLGVGIDSMVSDFETSITKEASKTPIPGGGVHQLTRYVMNYMVFLADYNESLANILTKSTLPLPEDYFGTHEEDDENVSSCPVNTRFAWLILVLLCKIDTKSRIYNDMALSYLFLANNLHYVISKVRTSNLKVVLGDEWMKNHEGKLNHYLENCEKIAWEEPMTLLSNKETLEEHVAKERLYQFNRMFEEAFKKQSSWVVPDSKIRKGLRDSVAKKLADATAAFHEKYKVENWKGIVRFTPEDFGNYLTDLYLGAGASCLIVPSSSLKPSESGRSIIESGR